MRHLVPLERLKKRSDFILASKAPYVCKHPAFVLQLRVGTNEGHPRVGFTVTKRQGSAVIRNRIKRRLREVVRLVLADELKKGADYVFIGRVEAAKMEFEQLKQEMLKAVTHLNKKAKLS